ncbi:MAG: hypothetical protein NTX53_20170 [candidate division WOR-3 bacterium]|nr:hypothetical protein [candidate division WOR-3 bacterium]
MDELDDMKMHIDLLDQDPDVMARACVWDFVCGVNRLAGTPMDGVGQDLLPSWEAAEEALDVLVAPRDVRGSWIASRNAAKRGIVAFRREKDLAALRNGLKALHTWLIRYAARRESDGRP